MSRPTASVIRRVAGRRPGARWLDLTATAVAVIPTLWVAVSATGAGGADRWLATAGLSALAVALMSHRAHPLLAAAAVTIAVVVGVPAVDRIAAQSGSPWVGWASITQFLAPAAVALTVGARLGLPASVATLTGVAVICEWALGGNVPLLIILWGWWSVGRVLRSRELVAERLRARAAELAAERARFVREAVRLERTTIARELHDVVAHCMTVIVIQARAGQHLLRRDPLAAAEAADVIRAVAAEAEADIAALVALMNPDRVVPLTRELLDELVSRAASTGTKVSVDISGDPHSLDPAVAATAYRVLQEALTNAFRYAPGADVRIDLRCTDPAAVMVCNDPPPTATVTPSLHGSGRGLTGIGERAEAVGGRFTAGRTSGGGWQVAVAFPRRPQLPALNRE